MDLAARCGRARWSPPRSWFAVLIALPWLYLVPWRPAGLPATSIELAFIVAKLSVTAILMAHRRGADRHEGVASRTVLVTPCSTPVNARQPIVTCRLGTDTL